MSERFQHVQRFPGGGLSASGRGLLLAGIVVLSAAASVAPGQEPEVIVELEREQIYEGESVRYSVTLNHVENPTPPELEGFDQFDVQPARERSLNSQHITVINGRRSVVVRRGRQYDYLLTPNRAGVLQVPAPTAEVEGQVLRGQPLTLEVIAPPEQDVAILEMTSSRETVYPMQPFSLRLTVAVKPLPQPYADRDPLTVQPAAPGLSIPWAEDELAEGIKPDVPWNRWLQPHISQRGFAVNNIQHRSDPFSGFFGRDFGAGGSFRSLFEDAFSLPIDDAAAKFLPKPQQRLREDARGRKMQYWEYTFERTFVPAAVGTYRFGPVTLEGAFGVDIDARGDLRGEKIYAIAKPIEVKVQEPPLAGRPESYVGAIGRFTAGAQLAPTQAKVGDPMTLTLWLRGQGTLDRVTAPKLEQLPGVAESFKVYEATEETQEDLRRLTYGLRPLRDDLDEFPSIAMSYFDVEQEQYVTLNTEPIPLEISPAERLSGREIAMAQTPRGGGQGIEASAEGIFANVTDLNELRDQTVRPERWFLSLGGMASVFLVLAVATRQIQRISADPGLWRRRTAAQRARQRMEQALQVLQAGKRREGADQMSAALIGLVADAAGVAESGLTSVDAARQLGQAELDDELIRRFTALMDACDHVRYGGSGQAGEGIRDEARGLLAELATALKRKKLLG